MFYRQSVTTGCGTSAIAKTRSLSKGFHNCTASPRGGSINHILRDSIPDSMNLQTTFLSQKLQPRVLWIGCSDSTPRESAAYQNQNDQSLELRNLGNMIIEGDLSCETMIKHAVVDLRVKDIVVCGHYGCRIVRSSSRDGLQGPWSRKLDSLHSNHEKDLSQLPLSEQDGSFVKFNVLDQLRSLRAFPEVSDAIALGSLRIHGVVYDPESNTSHRLLE